MASPEQLQAIASEIASLAGLPQVAHDQELFASGLLDSLNVLHILTFLESRFGLRVGAFDVTLEHLDSVQKIGQFVAQKLATA